MLQNARREIAARQKRVLLWWLGFRCISSWGTLLMDLRAGSAKPYTLPWSKVLSNELLDAFAPVKLRSGPFLYLCVDCHRTPCPKVWSLWKAEYHRLWLLDNT